MKNILLLLPLLFTIQLSYAQATIKKKKDKYAVTQQGKKKDFIYSTVEEDYNGFFLVEQDGKWGLLDTEGQEVAAPQYNQLKYNGYTYIAQLEEGYGTIDKAGKVVLPFEYDAIHSASKEGTGIVKKNGKWAWLEDGKLSYEKEKLIFTIPNRLPMFTTCSNIAPNYQEMKSCADKKLLEYISQHISYPKEAIAKETEGMVVISFVVTDKGIIQDIEILREIGNGCGEAAKKVFADMSQPWVPAMHDGKKVYCKYNIPVRFKLK